MPTSRLTDDAVRDLRQRYATKTVTLTALAAEYGIALGYAHRIVTGKVRVGAGGPLHVARPSAAQEAERRFKVAEFWSKVDDSAGPTACWPWRGRSGPYGHGALTWEQRSTTAYRVAFELANGRKQRPKTHIRHLCDFAPCCNPAHLREGTAKENSADRVRRAALLKSGWVGPTPVPKPEPGPFTIERGDVAALRRAWEAERFWLRVDRSGGEKSCWAWTATTVRGGYGQVVLGNKRVMAHIVAYELAKRRVPRGQVVRHDCDNPPCCNPRHLRSGTTRQNRQDAVKRRRTPRGERGGLSKLTDAQVAAMREAVVAGKVRQYELVRELGMSRNAIASILHGRTYRDAGGPVPAYSPPRRKPVDLRKRRRHLTAADVVEMRIRYARGASLLDLTTTFRCSRSTLLRAVRGEAWRHVGGPITVKSHLTKIDAAGVLRMRQQGACGVSLLELAREYGMSKSGVHSILTGVVWKQVGGPLRIPHSSIAAA